MDYTATNVCDFYVENSEYKVSAAKAIQSLKQDLVLWYHQLIGNDVYGDKTGPKGIPLLQVGDFGAFLANKHLTRAPDGRIPWTPYYDELLKAGLVWPIRKFSANCLKILRGVQGLYQADNR